MKNQKNALLFIFITLLIDCTGIGIIIPVTPKLIQELIGGDISQASKYGGWLAFSYGIMQFLFSSVRDYWSLFKYVFFFSESLCEGAHLFGG